MQLWLDFKVLVLLTAANGAPVLGKKLFRGFLGYPIDAGCIVFDGQRLLGDSKTIRGVFLSAIFTSAWARAVGFTWHIGVAIALAAMAGDLLSSFIKRRLGWPPSSMALGLDQVPESLFPTLLIMHPLGLEVVDLIVIVIAFFVGELGLSRLLFNWRIRDEPY